MNIITTGSLLCFSQTPEGVVTVTNNDTTKIATGVTVTFTTPPGLVYASLGASQGIFDGTLWQVGSVAPGATATLDACYEVTDECAFPAKITYVVSQGCADDASNNSGERCFDPTTCKDILSCIGQVSTVTLDPATGKTTITQNDGTTATFIGVTSIVDNGNGSCTITFDNGVVKVIPLDTPVLTDNGDGTCTATFADGTTKSLVTGVQSTAVDNGDGTSTITQNDGSTAETITGTLTSPDGTISVVYNATSGEWEFTTTHTIDTDLKCVPRVDNTDPLNPLLVFDLVDNITGNVITPDVVSVPLSSSSIVDNGDGTATLTINGVTKTLLCAGTVSTIVQNPDGSFTITQNDGTVATIPSTSLVDNGDGTADITVNGITTTIVTGPITSTDNSVTINGSDLSVTHVTNTDGTVTLNDGTNVAAGPIVIEGGNNTTVDYDAATLTWTVNGCCTTYDPTTGVLTTTDVDGVVTTNVIATAISAGDNILITGTGTPSDPYVINGCCVSFDPTTSELTITEPNGATNTYNIVTSVTSADGTVTIDNTTPGVFDLSVPVSSYTEVNNNDGTTSFTIIQDGVTTTGCYKNCDVGNGQPIDGAHTLTCDWTPIFAPTTGPDLACTFGVTTYEYVSSTAGIEVVPTGNGGFMVKPVDCSQPIAGTESLTYEMFCDGVSQGTADEIFTYDVSGDLVVGKDFSVDYAETGEAIQLTLTAFNAGPGPLTGVVLTDTLLPNFSYVSDDGGSAGSVTSTAPFVWDIGNLAAGAQEVIVIDLTVAAAAGFSALPNVVLGESNEDDDAFGTDVVLETPILEADLAIEKTVGKSDSTANAGDTITFTLTVTNNGPATSTGFTVEDILNASFINVTSSASGVTVVGNTVTWNNNIPLPATQSTSIQITAEVGAGSTGIIPNTATITNSNELDVDPTNDSDNDEVRILESNLSIVKTEILPPESRVVLNDPDATSGVSTGNSITNTKDGGAVIGAGEPQRIVIEISDAGQNNWTKLEELTGLTNGNFTSFTTDGGTDSLLSYITGTTGSFDIDKKGWADANDYNYRAIIDGITDLTDIGARTNAQDIRFTTYVGGNGSVNCIVESFNPDNIDEIGSVDKIFSASIYSNYNNNASIQWQIRAFGLGFVDNGEFDFVIDFPTTGSNSVKINDEAFLDFRNWDNWTNPDNTGISYPNYIYDFSYMLDNGLSAQMIGDGYLFGNSIQDVSIVSNTQSLRNLVNTSSSSFNIGLWGQGLCFDDALGNNVNTSTWDNLSYSINGGSLISISPLSDPCTLSNVELFAVPIGFTSRQEFQEFVFTAVSADGRTVENTTTFERNIIW